MSATAYKGKISAFMGPQAKMFPDGVTQSAAIANTSEMEPGVQENVVPRQSYVDLDRWMERYQQADPAAPTALVVALSPALLRFFRSQVANREQADDLLQETWMRISRLRHTYRPGAPVLPWVYAIARRVGADGYPPAKGNARHSG